MAGTTIDPIAHRSGHAVIRRGPLAVRINARNLLLVGLLLVVVIALMVVTMTLGTYDLSVGTVANAVIGHGAPDQVLVVHDVRLPRVLAATLTGAALAIAGALFQGLVRNPLVSPDIIGINAGAGLAAVFWIVSGLSVALLPLAAFIGALLAAAAVYLLARRGGVAPARLVLVGIGGGAMLNAATVYLTVRTPIEQARPALVWSIGSVEGADWRDIRALGIFVAVGLPLAMMLTRPLRAIQLGDDTARMLGLPLERMRLAILALGCALAAVAVAIAGPIGFVALMVPHAARMLAGPISGTLILFTATLGALFLLVADTIGYHFLPVSLPAGVVTAALGAPYFLFLLYRVNTRL